MTASKLITFFALGLGSLPAANQTIEGVWQSEGWGSVYEIKGTTLRSFEVTSTTCVQSFSAERIHRQFTGNRLAFRSDRKELFYIVDDVEMDHKHLERPASLSRIGLRRVSALPVVCRPPTANTPIANFDVFAHTFAEHYIAFDLRHVDWNHAVANQRAKVTSQTSPAQLFEILKAMIQPLADIHTGIEALHLKRTYDPPLRPGTDRIVRGNIEKFARAGRRELARVTDREYFHNRLSSFCRGQWRYGLTETGVGYLRIFGFGDYARRGGVEHELRALNYALDRILGSPQLRGLVIDVRLSFGGDDRLGLAMATRLTTREYTAYNIQARSDPERTNAFTPLQPVLVKTGRGPTFAGPIVELTGPITMSAAETFTQALMARRPQVVRIGENTQGVFCDPLERRLPNGWLFELPNAVYRTSDNRAFDVAGIPPDIHVPVFADEDLAAGRDPVMAAAMQVLLKK